VHQYKVNSATTTRFLAAPLAIALALTAGSAHAVDTVWDNGVGDFDYNKRNNWDPDFLPEAQHNEVAVIDNGDAVFLNSGTEDPAGLRVENLSSLEIRSSGSLNVAGDVTTGQNGTLTLLGSGSLTASAAATLAGNTRLVGPSATFQAGGITLGSDHALINKITDPNNHSVLSTAGTATLNGSLILQMTSANPSLGDSWNVVDAGTINGAFPTVTVQGLPLGQTFLLQQVGGGANGQLLRATLQDQLVLTLDAASGDASIANLSTTQSESIDAYAISTNGAFDLNGWHSFEDDGQADWEEANPTSQHLSELSLQGSRVIGSATSVGLGTPFVPPSQFGVAPEVEFEYALAGSGGETRTGAVSVENYTLVLQVNVTNGNASILNPSGFDVNLDGYIISPAGSLDINTWTPLADSDSAWWESNPLATHVSELNLTGSESIGKLLTDSPLSLGAPFDFDQQDVVRDLVFEFSLVSDAGDFDGDGDVDGQDVLQWQRGQSPNPFSASDLADWETSYGASAPSGTFTGVVQYVTSAPISAASAQVPEPTSSLLLFLGVLGFGFLRVGPAPAGRGGPVALGRGDRSRGDRILRIRLFPPMIMACVFVGALFSAAPAQATLTPTSLGTAEGNTSSRAPLHRDPLREQDLYAGSEFVPTQLMITEIRYRRDSTFTPDHSNAYTATFNEGDIEIRMSTTSTQVDAMSTTFADNVGADELLVHNGPITITSTDTTANDPKPLDIIIPLETPFLYDPSQGNLLVDFKITNDLGLSGIEHDFHDVADSGLSRVLFLSGIDGAAADPNSPVANLVQTGGPVTKFVFDLVNFDLGDFDFSGVVDTFDFGMLRDHMLGHLDGQVTYTDGDIDFDGDVDVRDFKQFQAAFPGVVAALGVPEPSSMALLSIVAALMLASQRRLDFGGFESYK